LWYSRDFVLTLHPQKRFFVVIVTFVPWW
jgi:hypothetical protein